MLYIYIYIILCIEYRVTPQRHRGLQQVGPPGLVLWILWQVSIAMHCLDQSQMMCVFFTHYRVALQDTSKLLFWKRIWILG